MDKRWGIVCVLMSLSAQASLVDENAYFVAKVRVLKSQTLQDQAQFHVPRLLTFHDAEVIECIECERYIKGDPIALATLGGAANGIAQRVAGAPQLSEGDESWVYASRRSQKWQAHVVIHSDGSPGDGERQSAFTCARVSPIGPSLFWPERQVVMRPLPSSDARVSKDDVQDAMSWAGKQWSEVGCSDFRFVLGPNASQAWVGYDWLNPEHNQNIVTLRKQAPGDLYGEWLHDTDALAMTSLTYVQATGEILDADIELNAERFWFTNCQSASCKTRRDLKNSLTHEYGHVLGLAHTRPGAPNARLCSMFWLTSEGDVQKRYLFDDDKEGLCALYPKDGPSPDCHGLKRAPVTAFAAVGKESSSCNQGSGASLWGWVALLFGLVLRKKWKLNS